jgi:BMFP domain-containing protein YqiC
MFDNEEFQKKIKAISDNVPDNFKTGIGGVIHWTISQALILYVNPRLAELEARVEELENANETRGLQESQGNEKGPNAATRRRKE